MNRAQCSKNINSFQSGNDTSYRAESLNLDQSILDKSFSLPKEASRAADDSDYVEVQSNLSHESQVEIPKLIDEPLQYGDSKN